MTSAPQYVTLVVQGGTPIRLADQMGAPYPTTGKGALVFSQSPTIDNPTFTGRVTNIGPGDTMGFGVGSPIQPSIYFGDQANDDGFFSSGLHHVNVTVGGLHIADFSTAGLGVAGNISIQGTFVGAAAALSGHLSASTEILNASLIVGIQGIAGSVRINDGGANNTGYIGFIKADGVRTGFIGYGNDRVNYNAETGFHEFTGPVTINHALTGTTAVFSGEVKALTVAYPDNDTTVATTAYVAAAVADAIGGSIPTGPAGGDLAGTYPDPTIKASVTLTGTTTLTGPLVGTSASFPGGNVTANNFFVGLAATQAGSFGFLTIANGPSITTWGTTSPGAGQIEFYIGGTSRGTMSATGVFAWNGPMTGTTATFTGSVLAANYFIANSLATDAGTLGFNSVNGPFIQMWGTTSAGAGQMILGTANVNRMSISAAGTITMAGLLTGTSATFNGELSVIAAGNPADEKIWRMLTTGSPGNFLLMALNDASSVVQKVWGFDRGGATTLPGNLVGTTATFSGTINAANFVVGNGTATAAGSFGFTGGEGGTISCWGNSSGGAGQIQFSTNNTGRLTIANSGSVFPTVDNASPLGGGSNRWTVVYAVTGAINTSGTDEKTYISGLSEAERRAANKIRALRPQRFKFKDAVEAKGDKARWHIGYLAEDVRDALAAENLDPWAYGMLCRDEVDGKMRLGLRYDELQAFLSSAG